MKREDIFEASELSTGIVRIDSLVEDIGKKASGKIAGEKAVYLITVAGFEDGSGEFLTGGIPVLTDELLESLTRTKAKFVERLNEIGVDEATISSREKK